MITVQESCHAVEHLMGAMGKWQRKFNPDPKMVLALQGARICNPFDGEMIVSTFYVQDEDTWECRVSAEQKLLFAILDRAVRDLHYDPDHDYLGTKNSARPSSIIFFQSERCDPFSFVWICEQLDIDPGAFLKGLRDQGLL